jgi:hypothetical protein
VSLSIGRVFELLQNYIIRVFFEHLLGPIYSTGHPFITWSQYKLCPQAANQFLSLNTHRLRHDYDQGVTPGSGHHSQSDTGISAGWLYNNPTWLQLPCLFGIPYHLQSNPVFDAPCGVKKLEFD